MKIYFQENMMLVMTKEIVLKMESYTSIILILIKNISIILEKPIEI